MTWIQKALSAVIAFFTKEKTAAHDFAVIADNLANVVKTAEASTIGQTVETTLELIIPASTGLVNSFKLYWPKLITVLNLAVAETGKTDQQIMVDGALSLAKMKGIDPNAYATTMVGIAANIKQWFMDNTGSGGTIQQGVLTAVVAHDPTLATVLNIPSIDVTNAAAPVNVQAPAPSGTNLGSTLSPEQQQAALSGEVNNSPVTNIVSAPPAVTGQTEADNVVVG